MLTIIKVYVTLFDSNWIYLKFSTEDFEFKKVVYLQNIKNETRVLKEFLKGSLRVLKEFLKSS